MELSLEEAYLAMFYMLDEYYNSTKNDDLGALLSSLNPHLFIDSISADSAAWSDWIDIVSEVTHEKKITSVEAFKSMIKFLEFYEKEFCFNLETILKELKNKYIYDDKWEEYINKIRADTNFRTK